MRIVITHLTRMEAPRICVAGIDTDAGGHVRPTTGRSHPLTRELLAEQGGPYALGALVDLGEVTPYRWGSCGFFVSQTSSLTSTESCACASTPDSGPPICRSRTCGLWRRTIGRSRRTSSPM